MNEGQDYYLGFGESRGIGEGCFGISVWIEDYLICRLPGYLGQGWQGSLCQVLGLMGQESGVTAVVKRCVVRTLFAGFCMVFLLGVMRALRVSGSLILFGGQGKSSLVILGGGGGGRVPRDVIVQTPGILEVSKHRFFPLTCIIGGEPGVIQCLVILVSVNLGMLAVNVSQIFPLTMRFLGSIRKVDSYQVC